MFGGDDKVIKRSIGLLAVCLFIITSLAFVFGIIQIDPGVNHKKDSRVCTYTYHAVVGWSAIRINAPVLPAKCSYEH
jgi:hypothetical protein